MILHAQERHTPVTLESNSFCSSCPRCCRMLMNVSKAVARRSGSGRTQEALTMTCLPLTSNSSPSLCHSILMKTNRGTILPMAPIAIAYRPARAVLAHAVSTHTDRKHGRTASDNHCWRYQFADACVWERNNGSKCKYDHLGDPAAFKLEVADEDGRCRNDSRPKGCTRKDCPFTHRAEDDPNATKVNPVMYPMLPRRKPVGPNDDCRMYHFGANRYPAY